jgi:hypothetical protein
MPKNYKHTGSHTTDNSRQHEITELSGDEQQQQVEQQQE